MPESASRGCLLLGGGFCSQGGVCSGGVCACSGGGGVCGIPACTKANAPPVNRMTNSSKSITLATTLLRPVIRTLCLKRYKNYLPNTLDLVVFTGGPTKVHDGGVILQRVGRDGGLQHKDLVSRRIHIRVFKDKHTYVSYL